MKQIVLRFIGKMNLLKMIFVLAMGVLLGIGCYQNSADAASSYLIKINKQANCVTIYKQKSNGSYKAVKALVCSTGYATKLGTYSLGEKMRWHTLDGPCYGQYCTRIYGGVLFHSVWYTGQNNPATLSISSYNKLGTTASHGCVRLTVAGAKWIYNNVPSGTKVIIYSSKNPGPLGKPKAIKLPYTYAWDPTDTDNPNNPWNKKKPKITGAKNCTVDFNSDFDVMKGIKATNTTGFNAKSLVKTKITYRGKKVSKVDTKTPGKYKVTYSLTDEIGRKASAKITVKVTAKKAKPKITGVKNLYVTAKKKLTKSYMLKGVVVKQSGKKLSSKYIKVKLKKVKTNVYKITYTAQRASVPVVATAKAYVDKKAPVIKGITNNSSYRVDKSVTINKTYARSLIKSVSDNFSSLKASDVTVVVTKMNAGAKYKVVYTLKDDAGNKTVVTIYLIPTEFVTISGPSTLEISAATLGCDENTSSTQLQNKLRAYLLNNAGITAKTYDNKDITSNLEVTLTENSTKVYTAVFTVSDASKHTASKTIQVKVL